MFLHGVASGDPQYDRVILWTRVSGLTSETPIAYQISRTPDFANTETKPAGVANAERDYTVKVDATGLLAGTTYYYRFSLGAQFSPVGRTRTAPENAVRLRFAVVSCASFGHGYFYVYQAIAANPNIDAVIHLGDYMYEYGNIGCGENYGGLRTYDPPTECISLSDYRRRYAHYRLDEHLQEAHRQHPFIVTWDDHEVANDSWLGGAKNHQANEGSYVERKAAAARAYFEWLPIRESEGTRVYRTLSYGNLAELIVLDTRHEGRDKQAQIAMDPQPSTCECLDLNSPERRILSEAQENFLFQRLRQSTARYKIICQQIMISTLRAAQLNTDMWDGYPEARARVFRMIRNEHIDNVLVLTGDIHSSWVSDLSENPSDPAIYDGTRPANRGSLAVEMVVPAITSPSILGLLPAETVATVRASLPHVRYLEAKYRGHLLVDVAAESIEGTYSHVSQVHLPEQPTTEVSPAFAVEHGAPWVVERAAGRAAPTHYGTLAQ